MKLIYSLVILALIAFSASAFRLSVETQGPAEEDCEKFWDLHQDEIIESEDWVDNLSEADLKKLDMCIELESHDQQ